jgi:ribose transport system substrate-binding protein
MVKRFTNFSTAAVAGALFVAGAISAQAQEPLKVTMIAYPPGDDFYFTIENAAREQAKSSNVALTVQKIPSYDLAAQMAVLNASIASGPDAIIVSPLDPNGLQAALEKAKELGITIVLYDTSTRDLSVSATFVSADIVELGRNAGREFQALAGERAGSVFYQGTAPAQPFFDSLHKGWEEVLGSVAEYKHLPVNYSDFEPAKAASEMQAVLASTPDLIGGFAGIYTDQQGNIPAIERAGKIDDLVLIGVDGAPQNVERLKQGKLDAIVSVKARDYGTEAIKAVVAAVAGEQLPEITGIGQCLLKADNLTDPANAACLYDLDKK